MNDVEIVKHLAEKVMGWTATHATPQGAQWFDCGDGARRAYWDGRPGGGSGKFNPLESIADAFEAEGRIPEGKRADYLGYLECIAGKEFYAELSCIWPVYHATPRQRCLAMVEATR